LHPVFYGSKTAVSSEKENQSNVRDPCLAAVDARTYFAVQLQTV
jgi:hypothetical protein